MIPHLSWEYLLHVCKLNSAIHRKVNAGSGLHMPGQHDQGQNPDFLMPGEVFLPESLITVLYLVTINLRATP